MKSRTCACGETFTPTREAQRFCSAACGSSNRMARMRSRNKNSVEGVRLLEPLSPYLSGSFAPPVRVCGPPRP